MKLWRSGLVVTALTFAGGLGNYVFAGMMNRHISTAEYGYMQSALYLNDFIGLPLTIIYWAITHYIAHFRSSDDASVLQGLLFGFRKFLLRATVGGGVLAIILLKPLSVFFNLQRPSLMLAVLACVLVGSWSGFALAMCQGMAWFKRMSFIGLGVVAMRLLFGWLVVTTHPTAEMAVSATTFSLLGNLVLLFWWKHSVKSGEQRSPWNRDFVNYLIVAAAFVGGTYWFVKADQLVAQRYFPGESIGSYTRAGTLARALPLVAGPLLTVLFTARSEKKSARSAEDQRMLLGLYAAGLTFGAVMLFVLRKFLVRLLVGHDSPEAVAMIQPFEITMVSIGLIQAIGTWSLASRWFKLTILYGVLGLSYWLILLAFGRTPADLLAIMPVAAGIAFVILCIVWLATLRQGQSAAASS